jgi:hypothetical protein
MVAKKYETVDLSQKTKLRSRRKKKETTDVETLEPQDDAEATDDATEAEDSADKATEGDA